MKPHVVGRLHAQGLDSPRFETAADVVQHLGCVQSQLHDMGLWTVARRTRGLTKREIDEAFARGDFLRTHVLRPTWHFVDPSDIHWLLAVTAPRIGKIVMSGLNTIGLSHQDLDRGTEVIVAVLADGASRTRAELGESLAGAGLVDSGQHLAHTVMHAEIEALIVNGPMRGKQHTYVLLDSVTAAPQVPSRDELLAMLARRYARGHGPIRDKDLAWWASLTLTESRRALELGELRPLDIDGEAYWSVEDAVEAAPAVATLMSNFDEYISYARDEEDFSLFSGAPEAIMRSSGLLTIAGKLAGTWTRTVKSRAVEIDVVPSTGVTPAIRRALEAEAASYGRFVEREPELRILR